jgi:hypothetical protein
VILGCQHRTIGHLDTVHLQAEADRLGKPLQVRAIPGRLLLVLTLNDGRELTADYWGAAVTA